MHDNNRPLKTCAKCNEQRVPEGGIDMGPTRWVCARCWIYRANSTKGKPP